MLGYHHVPSGSFHRDHDTGFSKLAPRMTDAVDDVARYLADGGRSGWILVSFNMHRPLQ